MDMVQQMGPTVKEHRLNGDRNRMHTSEDRVWVPGAHLKLKGDFVSSVTQLLETSLSSCVSRAREKENKLKIQS